MVSLETKIGEEFEVALESNPTTGYDWEFIVDEKFEFISSKFEAGSAVGERGKRIFKLKSKEKGFYKIKFEYKRPWEYTSLTLQEYIVEVL